MMMNGIGGGRWWRRCHCSKIITAMMMMIAAMPDKGVLCLSTTMQHYYNTKYDHNLKYNKGDLPPRLEYNEWTPLGRGDPLKNDPTFDYSPPVLDKVKYWVSPSLRTPDPPIMTEKNALSSSILFGASSSAMEKQSNIKSNSPINNVNSLDDRFFETDYSNSHPIKHRISNTNFIMITKPPPLPSTIYQRYYNKDINNNNFVGYRDDVSDNQLKESSVSAVPHEPLPMLVPPLPTSSVVDSYAASMIIVENATNTRDYVSWDSTKVVMPIVNHSIAANSHNDQNLTLSTNSSVPELVRLLEKSTIVSSHPENRTTVTVDVSNDAVTPLVPSSSYLQLLLGKEASLKWSSSNTSSTVSTAIATSTRPSATINNSNSDESHKLKPKQQPMHIIIQGHSKVKTYRPKNVDTLAMPPLAALSDYSNEVLTSATGNDYVPFNNLFDYLTTKNIKTT